MLFFPKYGTSDVCADATLPVPAKASARAIARTAGAEDDEVTRGRIGRSFYKLSAFSSPASARDLTVDAEPPANTVLGCLGRKRGGLSSLDAVRRHLRATAL